MSLPALTTAELQVTKEFLGLSTGWLARRLVIHDRRLRRMEAGVEDIPAAVVELLDEVFERTKQLVWDMSADYRRKVKGADGGIVALKTYRTDDDYCIAMGGPTEFPAKWHRQVCARVLLAVPGLVLIH